jgi:hypothetical protein
MSAAAFLHAFLHWSLVVAVGYLLVSHAFASVALAAASRRRNRETALDAGEQADLAASRFTVPVSIVVHVPGPKETTGATDAAARPFRSAADQPVATLRSLLALEYGQVEVIAVGDFGNGPGFESLKREFGLAARQMFYRRSLAGAEVRAIYGSAADDRLLVVDQPRGGSVEAWNCGINIARYRYVAIADAGRLVAPDALLSAMAPANADPAGVVAILGHLGSARSAEAPASASAGRSSLAAFEEIERLREGLGGPATATDLRTVLDSPQAFGLWRRDAVVEAGGFSADTAGAGLDLAWRLRERASRQRRPCRVLLMAQPPASEAEGSIREAIAKRARWHRVMLETLWRDRSRLVALHGVGGLADLVSDLLPGACEAWLYVALPVCALTGVIGWVPMFAIAGIASLARASVTNLALLLDAGHPGASSCRPVRVICFGALEFPLYRPLAALGAAMGSWGFIAGPRVRRSALRQAQGVVSLSNHEGRKVQSERPSVRRS